MSEHGTRRRQRAIILKKKYIYRGIAYELIILDTQKHFFSGIKKGEAIIKMNKIGKHVVLEYPKEIKEIADFIGRHNEFADWGLDEWLYRDTLHSGQENWSLKQMIKQMHLEARECIDGFFGLANARLKPNTRKEFAKIIKKRKLIPEII